MLRLEEEQTGKDCCPLPAVFFPPTVCKSVQYLMDDAVTNESWICPHLTVSLTITNGRSLANTINTGAEQNKIPPE